MQGNRITAQEAAEDIFFGQVVMNWARWFIIGAAAIVILGTAERETDLVAGIWPVVGLMVINFYLHLRRSAERPANPGLITLGSLLDLGVVTGAVYVGLGAGLGDGIQSPFFVAYYPVVLAFAFVMPTQRSIAYTLLALGAFTAACVAADGSALLTSSTALESLAARLITIAATGGLGAYFWRIQRRRRRDAARSVADVPAGSTEA